jgi:glycerate-2-kinase
MRSYRYDLGMIIIVVAAGAAATACSKSTPGHATHTTPGGGASRISTAAPSAPASATPTGQPVGTAVMKVSGGSAPVTIRYRINGGPEQTEANVPLPWEKQYAVYNEVESQVTADGGDAALTCTITMDGDKLVSLKSEPRPTCNFAYWG